MGIAALSWVVGHQPQQARTALKILKCGSVRISQERRHKIEDNPYIL